MDFLDFSAPTVSFDLFNHAESRDEVNLGDREVYAPERSFLFDLGDSPTTPGATREGMPGATYSNRIEQAPNISWYAAILDSLGGVLSHAQGRGTAQFSASHSLNQSGFGQAQETNYTMNPGQVYGPTAAQYTANPQNNAGIDLGAALRPAIGFFSGALPWIILVAVGLILFKLLKKLV